MFFHMKMRVFFLYSHVRNKPGASLQELLFLLHLGGCAQVVNIL